MKLKSKLPLLIILLFSLNTIGQDELKVEKFDNDRMIKLFNDSELISGIKIDYFSVKVFLTGSTSVKTEPESSQSYHNLVIAISENGVEYPKQSLFEIGPFLNPRFVDFIDPKECETHFIIEHGVPNQRERTTLF
jgi:hypothetical protein